MRMIPRRAPATPPTMAPVRFMLVEARASSVGVLGVGGVVAMGVVVVFFDSVAGVTSGRSPASDSARVALNRRLDPLPDMWR